MYEGLRGRERTSLCCLVMTNRKWVTVVSYMPFICAPSPVQRSEHIIHGVTKARTETSTREVVCSVLGETTEQLVTNVLVVSRALRIILGGLLLLPEALSPYPTWISFRRY